MKKHLIIPGYFEPTPQYDKPMVGTHFGVPVERGQLSISFTFSQQKFHFSLPDGRERDVLTGEPVAIANGGGDPYLRYGEQRFSVNLKWVAEPLYEWRIYDASGAEGQPIEMGKNYALYNVKVKPEADFLIFLEKHYPRVVDLGWPSAPLY